MSSVSYSFVGGGVVLERVTVWMAVKGASSLLIILIRDTYEPPQINFTINTFNFSNTSAPFTSTSKFPIVLVCGVKNRSRGGKTFGTSFNPKVIYLISIIRRSPRVLYPDPSSHSPSDVSFLPSSSKTREREILIYCKQGLRGSVLCKSIIQSMNEI